MRLVHSILLTILFKVGLSQTLLQGTVTDITKSPLNGANVYIKGNYDGTTTDSKGRFSFNTDRNDTCSLIVSYIGFITQKIRIDVRNFKESIQITMLPATSSLEEVSITAGSFEASTEKKNVILRPLDIATTAGAMADINAALNMLPGTQVVGETGQLFVRGGAASETHTYMDGLRVFNPYTSRVPDIPSRGRFSPFLFKGTVFSSGGYGSEYGQALSAVLLLNTLDLPEESVTGLSLMTVGGELSHTQRWNRTSLALTLGYSNLAPYYKLAPQRIDWEPAPQGYSGMLAFRHQEKKGGLWKLQALFDQSRLGIHFPSLNDTEEMDLYRNRNLNGYLNATYRQVWRDKWSFKAGCVTSYNKDSLRLSSFQVPSRLTGIQALATLNYTINKKWSIKGGWVGTYQDWQENYSDSVLSATTHLIDRIHALYTETEIRPKAGIAYKAGLRLEHSGLLAKNGIAPRFSAALKLGKYGQSSLAWGLYFQSPEPQLMRVNKELGFERSQHLILNYQWENNKRIFRIEGYYKRYLSLVSFDSSQPFVSEAYNNNGQGYAKGIEFFWRDQKSLTNTDYWISYSYLDTRRTYAEFTEAVVPTFASRHNFAIVAKRYVSVLSTQFGLTYRYASPRRFQDPNLPGLNQGRTPDYHDLSINASYLTQIFGCYTILYVAVNNALGNTQVFGYRYATHVDTQGLYPRQAIQSPAIRFYFVGLFISIQ